MWWVYGVWVVGVRPPLLYCDRTGACGRYSVVEEWYAWFSLFCFGLLLLLRGWTLHPISHLGPVALWLWLGGSWIGGDRVAYNFNASLRLRTPLLPTDYKRHGAMRGHLRHRVRSTACRSAAIKREQQLAVSQNLTIREYPYAGDFNVLFPIPFNPISPHTAPWLAPKH